MFRFDEFMMATTSSTIALQQSSTLLSAVSNVSSLDRLKFKIFVRFQCTIDVFANVSIFDRLKFSCGSINVFLQMFRFLIVWNVHPIPAFEFVSFGIFTASNQCFCKNFATALKILYAIIIINFKFICQMRLQNVFISQTNKAKPRFQQLLL